MVKDLIKKDRSLADDNDRLVVTIWYNILKRNYVMNKDIKNISYHKH